MFPQGRETQLSWRKSLPHWTPDPEPGLGLSGTACGQAHSSPARTGRAGLEIVL